ncbi:MAG: AIM24 family protein, partial [Polyangiales bacterium]
DGTEPRGNFFDQLFGAGKRLLVGESLFLTHFRNTGASKQRVAFAAPYPGKILAIPLAQLGGELLCQKDGFLAAAYGTQLSVAFNQRLGAGFFGGEGFILQRLQGDGLVFVHAGGTVIRKELRGERLRVDTGCVVAFTPGIQFDIERAGNLRSMLFGGEGLFLATLQGTGTVWVQSMPFSRLADRVLASAPKLGGTRTEEGSILGGLGGLLDGD